MAHPLILTGKCNLKYPASSHLLMLAESNGPWTRPCGSAYTHSSALGLNVGGAAGGDAKGARLTGPSAPSAEPNEVNLGSVPGINCACACCNNCLDRGAPLTCCCCCCCTERAICWSSAACAGCEEDEDDGVGGAGCSEKRVEAVLSAAPIDRGKGREESPPPPIPRPSPSGPLPVSCPLPRRDDDDAKGGSNNPPPPKEAEESNPE